MLQDYKLGVRMLLKYPGLTIAGGLALAIAIGIGAGWYDLADKLLWPSIPLPEGDRVVCSRRRMPWRTSLSSVSLGTSSNGGARFGRSTISGRTARTSGI